MKTIDSSGLVLLDAREAGLSAARVPAHAASLRARGAEAVCVLEVALDGGRRLHWLDCDLARGWIEPGIAVEADRDAWRTDYMRASEVGFVAADAALLACMAAHARPGSPPELPRLSWGEEPLFAALREPATASRPLGIYALVDSADRLSPVLAAGVRTVQLRIKSPATPDASWPQDLRARLAAGLAIARAQGAELFVNDHWALAQALGAPAVHLGQEDLLALGEAGRARLLASGVALGISSHSVWELCRARALSPRYIACGPVWPTTTKDMPWMPQGLDNLAWWCRMAGAPVVAIGGILRASQVRDCAAAGASGVCIVRGLGEAPQAVLPGLLDAFEAGRAMSGKAQGPHWPHPTLAGPRQGTAA
jgi:hydroxymethylpyrimidine kinase / phosphomethylpyrimidine kinase / thiamine-phosphate diphosphorylase